MAAIIAFGGDHRFCLCYVQRTDLSLHRRHVPSGQAILTWACKVHGESFAYTSRAQVA